MANNQSTVAECFLKTAFKINIDVLSKPVAGKMDFSHVLHHSVLQYSDKNKPRMFSG